LPLIVTASKLRRLWRCTTTHSKVEVAWCRQKFHFCYQT